MRASDQRGREEQDKERIVRNGERKRGCGERNTEIDKGNTEAK